MRSQLAGDVWLECGVSVAHPERDDFCHKHKVPKQTTTLSGKTDSNHRRFMITVMEIGRTSPLWHEQVRIMIRGAENGSLGTRVTGSVFTATLLPGLDESFVRREGYELLRRPGFT